MRGRGRTEQAERDSVLVETAVSTADMLLLRLCASARQQAEEGERLGMAIERASRSEAARLVGPLGRAQRTAHTLAEQAVTLRPRTPEGLAAMAALAIRLAGRDEDGRCTGTCVRRCLPIAVLEHAARLEKLDSAPPQTRA